MARRRRRGFVDSLNAIAKPVVRRRLYRPSVAKKTVLRAEFVVRNDSPVVRRTSPVRNKAALRRGPKRAVRLPERIALDDFGPSFNIGIAREVLRDELRKGDKCASRQKRREVLFALDLRRKGKGGSRMPKSTDRC